MGKVDRTGIATSGVGGWTLVFGCQGDSHQPSAVGFQQENYGLTNILFADSR